MVILVPVGHLLDNKASESINIEKSNGIQHKSQDWPSIIARARKQVVGKLTERLGSELQLGPGEDFESLIATELVNTPLTWRDNLNLHKGSILGLSHNILQVLCLRPRLIHDTLKVIRECKCSSPAV